MTKIKDIDQLNAEIVRLKRKVKEQEDILRNDFLEVKESLKPSNILVNGLASLTGVKMSANEFLKDGLAYGLSILFQRFILKTENKMEHKVYELVDTVLEKVKKYMEKFTGQEAKQSERKDNDTPSV